MTISKSTYPWIGISRDEDVIVLFIAEEEGIILYMDSFYDGDKERLLTMESAWDMDAFKELKADLFITKNEHGYPKLRTLNPDNLKKDKEVTLDDRERTVFFINEDSGVILSGYMEHDHGRCYRDDWVNPTDKNIWNKYNNKWGETI